MPTKNVPLSQTYKKEIQNLVISGSVKIENAARYLGMPVRTMQRRLHEAGLTYSELVDEVRYELACEKLKTCRMSVGTIAGQLGFTNASNFSRAFQRWSGMSPSTYRHKHSNSPVDPG